MTPRQLEPATQESGAVRWFPPDDDVPLVLWGAHGARIEELARELRHVQAFIEAEVDPPTRIIFDGPSGTGKTMAARWLGRLLKRPVGIFDVSQCVSKYMGETASNLKLGFDQAERTKSIIFLDEIDAVCMKRTSGDGGACDAEMQRVTSSIFQRIDWMGLANIVIAATNFHERLDSALTRRMPTRVTFTLPDREARDRLLSSMRASALLDAEGRARLLDETEGASGADTRAALMAAVRPIILAEASKPVAKRSRNELMAKGMQGLLIALEAPS